MQTQEQKKELTSVIDSLVDEYFGKSSENFEVAPAAKTTADKVMAEVPGSQDDAARGAGRPKDDHDVPKTDTDGNAAKGYDAVQAGQAEVENPEAKQAGAATQISGEGRLGEKKHMTDPRLSKSLEEDPEYKEFLAFKKAKKEQEDLKKADDLKKAQTDLIKSAVEQALTPYKKENEDLRKAFQQQSDLLKAIAGQPREAKSITSIDVVEKSLDPSGQPRKEAGEFTRKEKLDAAEALVMKKSLPADAVIELENTGTVYNAEWRRLIEEELQKQN